MKNKLVTIATYRDVIEANIYKAKLQSAGIYCFLADENTIGANWLYSNAVGGIKLQVAEIDLQDALQILKNKEEIKEVNLKEDNLSSPNQIHCPNCQSTNIGTEKYSKKVAAWSWIFLGFPIPFLSKSYHCFDCGYEWKANK